MEGIHVLGLPAMFSRCRSQSHRTRVQSILPMRGLFQPPAMRSSPSSSKVYKLLDASEPVCDLTRYPRNAMIDDVLVTAADTIGIAKSRNLEARNGDPQLRVEKPQQ
ncbi:hypothetical protein ACMD2_00395 [Ananas comosus]|uniref:Uncharacterized protein n=1 Tax=Ananas comosus TaxID=4615 RepID=A0A199URP3_ANACO|nr:hypothetical protein ACMD2_00395 [Ananas comosus]